MDPPRGPPRPTTYRQHRPSDERRRHRDREPSVHDLAEEVKQLRADTEFAIDEIRTGSHDIPTPAPVLTPVPPAPRLTSSPPWLRAADKKWRQISIAAFAIAATAIISALATSAVKDCQSALDRERVEQLHK